MATSSEEPTGATAPQPPPVPAAASTEHGAFRTFWTSLPGVLTGVAAVVAAVVSLLAVFGPGHGVHAVDGAAAPGPVAASDAAVPVTPAGGPGSASTTGASPTVGGTLVAEGTLDLRVSEFADLRSTTMSASRNAGSDFFLSGGDGFYLDAAVGETLALAHGAGDRADCVATLPRRSDPVVSLRGARSGDVVCVLTSDLEIGVLTVQTRPSTGSPVFVFSYQLWR